MTISPRSTAGPSRGRTPGAWRGDRLPRPEGRSSPGGRQRRACTPSRRCGRWREKTDVVIIVLKNDAYAILNLEMARVRENELNARMKKWMLDLDKPTLDWVNISTGLGVPATRAGTAEEFHRQFEAALGDKGPHLIECQVVTPKEWAALEDYIHRPLRLCSVGNRVKPVLESSRKLVRRTNIARAGLRA